MTEFVKINNIIYECSEVITSAGYLSFTTEGDYNDIEANCKNAHELSVSSSEGGEPYGNYNESLFNVRCSSITNHMDGNITVVFSLSMISNTEKRLAELEKTQEEQDEIIAEILFGGEEIEDKISTEIEEEGDEENDENTEELDA